VRIAIALFLAATGPGPADVGPRAAPVRTEVDGSITFRAALQRADEDPTTRGLREALRVRRAGDAKIRGVTDPLQVSLYPGARVAPAGERGPQLQLQISQQIPLSRVGAARKQAATAEREQLSAAADAARLQRRLEVAEAWLQQWALQHQAEVLRRELQASDGWTQDTRRLVDAGEAKRTELSTALAWRTEVELDVLALEGDMHHAGLRLAELVGRDDVEQLGARGQPPTVPLDDASLLRLAELAEDLPAVRRPRLAAAAARAREVEIVRDNGWKLAVGGMAQMDQPGPALGVFGQIGVQIPMGGRNERARAVELGQAATLDGEAEAAARQTRREIRDALHELHHTGEQLEALRERLVPALDEIAELELRSLTQGETTTRRVVEARRSSLAGHRRVARTEGERAWAELRVWLLIVALEDDTAQDPS
jgi:outer membrane protein TolC